MHDESISQAEIDALVRGLTGGPESGQAPVSAPAHAAAAPSAGQGQIDLALLQEPFREFAAQAGGAFGELVGMPSQVVLTALSASTLGEASQLVSGEFLTGRSNLTAGLNGPVYYLVPTALGMEMITQLYGGIAPSALDDSALGALADGLAQMNQAGLNRFSELLGRPLMSNHVETQAVASLMQVAQGAEGHPVLVAALDLTVADASGRFYLVVGQQEVGEPLMQAVRNRQVARPARAQPETMKPAVGVQQPAGPTGASARQAAAAAAAAPASYQPAQFPDLAPRVGRDDIRNMELLMDVSLQVTVELGRTRRQIRDVLSLGPGSVLELDKLAGEQVDVLVNGKLIAKGEVVVIDENYGVRITDIISPAERVQSLK